MKITDIIVSAIIKKGVLFEARKVDTEVKIPVFAMLHHMCYGQSVASVGRMTFAKITNYIMKGGDFNVEEFNEYSGIFGNSSRYWRNDGIEYC